jgi:hypothetical protein
MPPHLTWCSTYLSRAQGNAFMRNPEAPRIIGQLDRQPWAPMWETNVERLQEESTTIYVSPPDYVYACKFSLMWESADRFERLFVQETGRSNMYVLCRRMSFNVPANRIPVSIILQVSKPSYDCADGKVSFAVHNLAGNLVGNYEFSSSRRVNVAMLKMLVKPDIEGYKAGSHQVSCI